MSDPLTNLRSTYTVLESRMNHALRTQLGDTARLQLQRDEAFHLLQSAETDWNGRGKGEQDTPLSFDPNIRLSDLSHGFRIFAFEDHLLNLPAIRYMAPKDQEMGLEVYLHARLKYPGEVRTKMHLMLQVHKNNQVTMDASLLLSFTDKNISPSITAAILGGMFYVAQELPKDVPLTVHCSSGLLVIATLQERSGRILFKKTDSNPAATLINLAPTPVELDTKSDLMFSNPGFL
ncbi:hypothetical protein B0H13DRAFT_2302314 [Mycena leptocephala]|nr:hypothetical protein B0H13DRAFT_2302314 [Mycena leptocephala]